MTDNSDEKTPGTERARLDTTGEFFSVGAPLHAVRAGYVRRAADNVLYETVVSGRYAHIIAPGRSGKSSLVAATSARLENNGFKVAILDLEQIGARDAGSDPGRWYYSVAYRLLRQLRIRIDLQAWWQDKSFLSNRQRLVEFYSEVILQNVSERIVVFVDEIQCIAGLQFADQLLASIRAAHNARATDPEFGRLTFVLLGESDPLSLIDEPELSPFNVTQSVSLGDFSRADLNLFATELGLSPQDAVVALDRVYYWTGGQPYLTQKLARAISREQLAGDVADCVDRLATQQLAGRAALHNEPHMSHIHREIVRDTKRYEALLNLYGRISKDIVVAADLGSPLHRRLIATGLLKIDEDGNLTIRNRLYAAVFTTRWANENLPSHWHTPAVAAIILLIIVAIPFWYTQLLPRSYVALLTSDTVELNVAKDAYINFRSFPGHVSGADNLYRSFVEARARNAADVQQIEEIAEMAAILPDAGRMPNELRAQFWDRKVDAATRNELRDEALIASLQALVSTTPQRRNRAAMLVADDYPLLLTSLVESERDNIVFDPVNRLLTETRAAEVSQWSLEQQSLQQRESWAITALEVSPLVRRVIVDRDGELRRVGLTLNLSHARASDLRIKVIAPSGRAVEVNAGIDRASSNQNIRIPAEQLSDLKGESLNGTWSLSVRDEEIGVAGQLVGWNLQLNSQGLVEDFQRGMNISDPLERETDNLWFSDDGRYAVARAMQSDSARVWDLAFAQPVRAVAVNELEQLIGLSAGARLLVTATQDTINLWDTNTGDRVATLPVGAGSATSRLTSDGTHLFVQSGRDGDSVFELWSLDDADISAKLDTAGTPALVSLDASGNRIAIADYDRAVRVWDLGDGTLVAQLDLSEQPSEIHLAAGGEMIGVVFGESGASLWRVDRPQQPVFEEFSKGSWRLVFSASGSKVLIGRADRGFQIYDSGNGHLLGPPLGSGGGAFGPILTFSSDEQIVVTAGPNSLTRFWRIPAMPPPNTLGGGEFSQPIWPAAGDAVATVTPDTATVVIGDRQGNVHILPANIDQDALAAAAGDVSFFGHNDEVRSLEVSADGSRVASVADDNTVRIWNVADGLPNPFIGVISGDPVNKLAFAPDASLIGILNGAGAQLMNAETGAMLARFDLGERHSGIAFADPDHLYVGSESGVLRVISRGSGDNWSVQTLWQGESPIRWLEASPRSEFLVLIDEDNVAQQFNLREGRIGESVLQLPSTVEELVFAPGGSRVLFRTARWIHRAGSSTTGLVWIDAILGPKAVNGARMVFGPHSDSAAATASRLYLPVAGDSFVRLVQLNFGDDQGPGLFGNKQNLLEEWYDRLGVPVEDEM
jgi:WD40 repeat protein